VAGSDVGGSGVAAGPQALANSARAAAKLKMIQAVGRAFIDLLLKRRDGGGSGRLWMSVALTSCAAH
jgi:hypothetical protein